MCSFLAAFLLPNFQPFRTWSLLHPCPTLPPRRLSGWQISSSSWPLRADPAGRLTSLPAPGPAATRLGSRQSRHRLPSPTSPGHCLDLLLRARLHSSTSPRIMSPVDDTHGHGSAVTSGFSGHGSMLAPGGHVPMLPHVPWSRSPIPFHVPRVTFLFPQPVHPLGSRSQCSDGGSAAHGSLHGRHGARLEDRSWSGVACRHAAALYSKRCASSISRAAGFIAGWSCGGE